MALETVQLEAEHVAKLLGAYPQAFEDRIKREELADAYLSAGSEAYCLLEDGQPVFAGGIVNLKWHRGEAWILPTPFFHAHVKTCFRILQKLLPEIAAHKKFARVQAVAAQDISPSLFEHLGFSYEGTMRLFGPNGETCRMYSRRFDEIAQELNLGDSEKRCYQRTTPIQIEGVRREHTQLSG